MAGNRAESDHMGKVAALGCIVCRNKGYPDTPAEIQHVIDQKNRDRNHLRVIPLCPIHHRTGLLHNPVRDRQGWDRWREVGYHQAPGARGEWEKRYGWQRDLLAQVERLISS